ncbi:MAG: hypothetical protein JSV84_18210 [Gemmatimonadota bacterium]|nr:MAG: hypothetical protein JSV84_18210 [Gemmatimonadota bacterium]
MTTIVTTILALISVMLITGTGSAVMKPMASAAIGGLTTATLSNSSLCRYFMHGYRRGV